MSELYKKAGGTFLLKFLGLGIAFVFQIILGRILNPELYGEYTMYLTYSTVFSIITILGMDRNLIKEIARYKGNESKEKTLLKFSTKISLLITIPLAGVLVLLKSFIGFTNYGLLLLLSMIVIKSMVGILDGYLQGKGKVVQVTLLNSVVNNILKMILFVILILLKVDSLNAAIFSFVLSEGITIILRSSQIVKKITVITNSKLSLSAEEKKLFIKYSLTVALITGIGLLLQNIDKIMISAYLDLNSVGVYKVAQNYVSLISVFVTPFVAFWPLISKLYNENNIGQIEKEMKRIVRIVTYLVIPMFFIFLFLGNDLLAIFGEAYVTNQAYLALIILAFSFLVDAVSGPIGSILTMTKHVKFALYNNIVALIINIVLNIVLIGRFGIMGVAFATGFSIILNNIISIIEVKLLLGIFSYDYRNLIQIISMGLFNYLLIRILINLISLDNIYFRIILFGTIIYGLNLIILSITQRKNIRTFLDRRRENANNNKNH